MVHSFISYISLSVIFVSELESGGRGLTGAHIFRYRSVVELGVGSVKDGHEELVGLC